MFVHNLVIHAIEQRELISTQLGECRREEALLRDKIKELKKVADAKIREELKKNALYMKLDQISDTLHKNAKDVEHQFIHWYYVCNECCEGWDIDWQDPEAEKRLRPLYEEICSAEMQCNEVMAQIHEQIRQKYYAEFDTETHALMELEDKEKQLTEYQKECYNTMCKALQPVLDVYVPLINDMFEKLGISTKDLTPTICPNLLEKGGWKISFWYDIPLSHTEEIEDDDFDEEGEAAKKGLEAKIEEFTDDLTELCEQSVPSLVEANVEYDDGDVTIEGDTYHHKGYYEYDTGYREPEGDFYYGDTTASTTLSIEIAIM